MRQPITNKITRRELNWYGYLMEILMDKIRRKVDEIRNIINRKGVKRHEKIEKANSRDTKKKRKTLMSLRIIAGNIKAWQ